MSDLISRQAAINVLEKILPANPLKSEYTQGITCGAALAIERVKQLPSAQPEIIRCKECKHWIAGYITDNDDFIAPKCDKYQQMARHSSNDFCSLAERREE